MEIIIHRHQDGSSKLKTMVTQNPLCYALALTVSPLQILPLICTTAIECAYEE